MIPGLDCAFGVYDAFGNLVADFTSAESSPLDVPLDRGPGPGPISSSASWTSSSSCQVATGSTSDSTSRGICRTTSRVLRSFRWGREPSEAARCGARRRTESSRFRTCGGLEMCRLVDPAPVSREGLRRRSGRCSASGCAPGSRLAGPRRARRLRPSLALPRARRGLGVRRARPAVPAPAARRVRRYGPGARLETEPGWTDVLPAAANFEVVRATSLPKPHSRPLRTSTGSCSTAASSSCRRWHSCSRRRGAIAAGGRADHALHRDRTCRAGRTQAAVDRGALRRSAGYTKSGASWSVSRWSSTGT